MSLVDVLVTFGHQFVAAPVQLISFWLSVSLPVVCFPLLFNGVRETVFPSFVGPVFLHVLTLFLGHGHRRQKA